MDVIKAIVGRDVARHLLILLVTANGVTLRRELVKTLSMYRAKHTTPANIIGNAQDLAQYRCQKWCIHIK